MSKQTLIDAGRALYGERWQTDLARDLGLSDGRRIRQWLSDDRPIPPGIISDLKALLKSRIKAIECVLNTMPDKQDG